MEYEFILSRIYNIVNAYVRYIYILLKDKINLKIMRLNYASLYNEFKKDIYIYIQMLMKKFSNHYSFSLYNHRSVLLYRAVETHTWYILSLE